MVSRTIEQQLREQLERLPPKSNSVSWSLRDHWCPRIHDWFLGQPG